MNAEIVPTPLDRLAPDRRARLAALPRSLVILLENVLAHETAQDAEPLVAAFDAWLDHGEAVAELPFRPSRILMQDTAGVAALADLAALRDHAAANGFAPSDVDAAIPVDLVIDHSVRVDHSGAGDAAARNLALEYARNRERYSFFKWAEQAFARLRVVPPGQGICHQINLEELTRGSVPAPGLVGGRMAETVIGTDSHTTMVNALGVLGWGVGGIEAELAALDSPIPIPLPRVAQVELAGAPRPGVTATDIALHLVRFLREAKVVDEIVEFAGEGLDHLALPDRAAIANMCPEYGATAALFPVDDTTLGYLGAMGRTANEVADYRAYARQTGLWRDSGPARRYSRAVRFDLGSVGPVMAGPSRPEQVRALAEVPASLRESFPEAAPADDLSSTGPANGAIAIAAITSCTNTANPYLMVAAGLLARNAVARGLSVPPWVKTSLAPGSRRIARLLERAGLQDALDALGFHVVGFGCTTCVGNSGELQPALQRPDAPALLVSVLSGNRNFENRIHPAVRANYLASPPMVVAAALAGTLARSLTDAPLGAGSDGAPVFLHDIWPRADEVAAIMASPAIAQAEAAGADLAAWHALPAPAGDCFEWDAASTFIQPPPFFASAAPRQAGDILDARPLLVLGDAITTDHISPIGRIQPGSPAAEYLAQRGTPADRYGSYGDRRANHDVMVRGTFDNARLANRLADAPGNRTPGPDGAMMSVFDAAGAFARPGVPLVIVAGENYGTGSARDWAAKGTALLGVRAVIARSFERIHRANLVAMGVLPVVTEDEMPPIGPEDRVSVRGIARLGPDCTGLVVEVTPPGRAPLHLQARADIRSSGQFALLRQGGIFAGLRRRFGA